MATKSNGLPSHWNVRRLDEVATIIDSLHKTPIYSDVGRPMIRVTDVQGGFLKTINALRVSDEVFDEFTRRYKPKRGDIVFSRVGTYGNASYVNTDEDFCLGQNTALLSPKINGRFLHLFLQSRDAQQQIDDSAVGSTQKTISLKSIAALHIPVPPHDELEAIAAMLGALDDKIELNRRMNATLEAIARALFQSWFVDFDPVRAKLDARQPTAVDPATAALFPSEFEHSQLGPIPKGWSVEQLQNVVKVVRGRSYRSTELATSSVALVTLKSFNRGGGYRADGLKPYTGEYNSEQRVTAGDLILAFTDVTQAAEVLGRPALVERTHDYAALVASLDIGIVRPTTERVSIPFLYCLFLTDTFRHHAYSHATGTTVLHLGAEALPSFKTVLPPAPLMRRFSEVLHCLFDRKKANEGESVTLRTTREALLPKLLSGELRVGPLNDAS